MRLKIRVASFSKIKMISYNQFQDQTTSTPKLIVAGEARNCLKLGNAFMWEISKTWLYHSKHKLRVQTFPW
jgi:hypothetical protein